MPTFTRGSVVVAVTLAAGCGGTGTAPSPTSTEPSTFSLSGKVTGMCDYACTDPGSSSAHVDFAAMNSGLCGATRQLKRTISC
jgi:hypothetical protein